VSIWQTLLKQNVQVIVYLVLLHCHIRAVLDCGFTIYAIYFITVVSLNYSHSLSFITAIIAYFIKSFIFSVHATINRPLLVSVRIRTPVVLLLVFVWSLKYWYWWLDPCTGTGIGIVDLSTGTGTWRLSTGSKIIAHLVYLCYSILV